jgi:site-specific DNA-methyltransferase (adenine-specific)
MDATKRTNDYDELRYPSSIQYFNNRDKDRGMHPTQKPVALFEYLIKTYTNEGDLVLDNCIGSGTTAIACIKANRRFIGMELEQKYVDIANKRIGEVKQEAMQSEARNSSQA